MVVDTFVRTYYNESMTQKREKPVTTTLSLDRATFKKLKHLAVERDTTVRALLREAVRQLLKTRRTSS